MSPSKNSIRVRRSSPNLSTMSVSSLGHDGPLTLRLGEDVLEVQDHRLELVVLVDDLLALEGGQAAQLHLEDGARLELVDAEQLDQAVTSRLDGGRAPDEGNDLVEGVERLEQATQHVDLGLGLAQPELGAPLDDLDLVLDPVPDERVDRQGARHPVDQRQHVGAEVVLQLGVLVEVVEHDLGHRVALEHDDEALAGAAGRLVADVGDAGQAAVLDQLGDLLRERVGVDLVGQLGDHEALPALDLLDLDDRAHDDRATAGAVGVLDALAAEDERTGGEVGAGDPGEHRVERLVAGGVRVGEQPLGGVGDLTQVVRRDVGGHADRDAGAAVDEQVGEPARQDDGLLRLAVVVVAEVDRVLVDVAHHLHGQRRHPALGVPRRGGRVVARAAEVALAVDQRVTQRPVLHQADEGVVDRGVTVRVVLTHHLTDDAAALVVAAIGAVATVEHRVDHATVHRLEPVAHVGQRPAHDHRHRVVDVAALHLGVEVDRFGAVVLDRRYLSHEFPCPSKLFNSRAIQQPCHSQSVGMPGGWFHVEPDHPAYEP